jgi:hypothetical protein
MPFFEIRAMKDFSNEEFDIFDENKDTSKGNMWDFFLPLDYNKLRKFF